MRLARRLADWGTVDAFGTILAGPAWRVSALGDDVIAGWARSEDRWWRRGALVSTVALNVPALEPRPGVLARVELAVPAHQGGEDPRRALAQQALDPDCAVHSWGGSSMIRRTSIGYPQYPTTAAVTSIARSSLASMIQ